MSIITNLTYRAMLYPMRRQARRFTRAAMAIEQTQRELLAGMLARNADTQFGKTHGFAKIRTFEEFARAVPIRKYDDLTDWIDKIASGQTNVLTCEPVQRFVPSSGSAAACKFIPYTQSLRRQFQQAIGPWAHSTYARWPELKRGRAYCSISPPAPAPPARGVIPVGFGDDSEYLGPLSRWAYKRLFVDASCRSETDNPAAFRTRHAAVLLAADDLRLVSIWSPTYFTTVLNELAQDGQAVFAQLTELAGSTRADRVRGALGDGDYQAIWPELKVISCWCDGPSATPAALLGEMFPNTEIQPKGLMATEAVVSLKLAGAGDPVLAGRSHVFEFIDTESEELAAPWSLEIGRTYRVIVSTAGGLWRYDLGDEVEVTGWRHTLPTLRFVGKDAMISDLRGEKLNALFVGQCLDTLRSEGLLAPGFAMLAPHRPDGAEAKYVLWLAADAPAPPRLAERLEQLLCENYHYKNCIHLGQLKPVELKTLAEDSPRAFAAYQNRLTETGMRPGEIKFSPLSLLNDWPEATKRLV
ncbi:MAG: GH3 auxin-responsive promoter [Phycisphaerales bacterium]|jgi:hypothetical protein|nr:GH3 auxin-responsive promoter [Phycisphaerales bacterium]